MFEKTIDYARESLIAASEAAVDRAGDRLGQVVDNASQAIDEKLDKISQELHSQRSMTKEDVREMVDYAAERLTVVLDERIAVMRREITGLVEEKTEYFKAEIDAFFIQRQKDLARERRRLLINIVLATSAALGVGAVSLFYKGIREWDLLTVFRVVLASLAGGYAVWLVLSLLRGWLRPASIFSSLLVLAILAILSLVLMFPNEALELIAQPILKPGN
jgi:hypothetical protein